MHQLHGHHHDYGGHNARGHAEGALAQASFNEPGGIAEHGNMLYVADTNNNALRVIDMAAGSVRTLDIALKASNMPYLDLYPRDLPNLQKLSFKVATGAPIDVTLALKDGWHINETAPSDSDSISRSI